MAKKQNKVLEELLSSVSSEKGSYSVKMDNKKIEILRKFFKLSGVNASDFFEKMIDFEELTNFIEKNESEKENVK